MTITGRLEKYLRAVAGGLNVTVPVGEVPYLFKAVRFGGSSPMVYMVRRSDGEGAWKTAAEWKRMGARW